MATTPTPKDFRDVMASHFEDISAIIRAAKCVYLAEQKPADQLRTLGGLLDVLEKSNIEAQEEIAAQDKRDYATFGRNNVVGLR